MKLIDVKNLVKTFIDGEKETRVLKGIDFSVDSGEFIAVMGRSGAGKSTFLYQLSLLDEPTSGEIMIFGKDTHNMTADEKTLFRLNQLGYVFQDYALLEQQRVSISRAIAHKPKILFADEPTANLDNESSKNIMNLFQEIHRKGQTIIMVTHEEEYAKLAKRVVKMDDGKIVEDIRD